MHNTVGIALMFRLQQLHIRSEAWRAIECVVPRPPAARHSLEGGAPAGRHAHAQRHPSPLDVACMFKREKRLYKRWGMR